MNYLGNKDILELQKTAFYVRKNARQRLCLKVSTGQKNKEKKTIALFVAIVYSGLC